MSRLYSLQAPTPDIADRFGIVDIGDATPPPETIEGMSGLVVFEHGDARRARSMTWGFPRPTRKVGLRGESSGRIGLVADLTNPMWEGLVVEPRYRCLIPLTRFANPDGDPGEKTRTWFSIEDEPLVAWTGFCRNTPEFGPVYAGMTMTANERVMPYNDRMPALLGADEHDRWLHGSIQDVIAFQFRPPLDAGRTLVEHTDDRWRSGSPSASGRRQPVLL